MITCRSWIWSQQKIIEVKYCASINLNHFLTSTLIMCILSLAMNNKTPFKQPFCGVHFHLTRFDIKWEPKFCFVWRKASNIFFKAWISSKRHSFDLWNCVTRFDTKCKWKVMLDLTLSVMQQSKSNLRTDRIEQLTFLELIRLSVSHFGVADLTDGKLHVSCTC